MFVVDVVLTLPSFQIAQSEWVIFSASSLEVEYINLSNSLYHCHTVFFSKFVIVIIN